MSTLRVCLWVMVFATILALADVAWHSQQHALHFKKIAQDQSDVLRDLQTINEELWNHVPEVVVAVHKPSGNAMVRVDHRMYQLPKMCTPVKGL